MFSVSWPKVHGDACVLTVKEAEVGWLLNPTAILQGHIVHCRIGDCTNDSCAAHWATVQSVAAQKITRVRQPGEAIHLYLLIAYWPVAGQQLDYKAVGQLTVQIHLSNTLRLRRLLHICPRNHEFR